MKKFLGILLFLAGCSAPVAEVSDTGQVPDGGALPPMENLPKEMSESVIHFQRALHGRIQTEDGLYLIEGGHGEPQQLFFVDFALGVEIPLSNRPDQAVSGQIPIGTSSPVMKFGASDEHLYLITEGAPWDNVLPAVYRMNLDGSGLAQIGAFSEEALDEDEVIMGRYHHSTIMVGDRLYYSLSRTDCEMDDIGFMSSCFQGGSELRVMDLNTGTVTDLLSTDGATVHLHEVFQGDLLLSKISFFQDRDDLWLTDRERWNYYESLQRTSVYALDLASHELQGIGELPRVFFEAMVGSELVGVSESGVVALDILTSEARYLADASVGHFQVATGDFALFQNAVLNLLTETAKDVPSFENSHFEVVAVDGERLLVQVRELGPVQPDSSQDIIDTYFAFIELENFLNSNFDYERVSRHARN